MGDKCSYTTDMNLYEIEYIVRVKDNLHTVEEKINPKPFRNIHELSFLFRKSIWLDGIPLQKKEDMKSTI